MTSDHLSRRELLRVGGLTVAMGAVLAACSADDDDAAPEAEPEGTEERSTTTEGPDPEVDVSLLNTALSLEVLIVDTYQVAFDFALVQSRAVVDAATLFRQHHQAARDVLIAAVEAADGEPFTTANPVVKAALVDPSLVSVTVERDFLTLARDLEQAAAQLLVHTAARSGAPELRATAMSIAGAAARRARVLDLLGGLGNERLALVPLDNPLPSDAVVTG